MNWTVDAHARLGQAARAARRPRGADGHRHAQVGLERRGHGGLDVGGAVERTCPNYLTKLTKL